MFLLDFNLCFLLYVINLFRWLYFTFLFCINNCYLLLFYIICLGLCLKGLILIRFNDCFLALLIFLSDR